MASAQSVLNQLNAAFAQMQSTFSNRMTQFQAEANQRATDASNATNTALSNLKSKLDQQLIDSNAARIDLNTINNMMSKQIGQSSVGFSRFTNPSVVSSRSASREHKTRRSTILGSTQGAQQQSTNVLGQRARA